MTRLQAQVPPLPWRVDCGDTNGKAAGEPGWLLLTETSAPAGMSLAPAAVDTVHVAKASPSGYVPMPSDVYTIDPDELWHTHRLTALQLADDTVLTLSGLPASKPLRVRLELGALSPWYEVGGGVIPGPATVSRQVRVEELTPGTTNWRTLASDVRCATCSLPNSYAATLGGIVSIWCLVHTDASGTLRLRFSTDGSDPVYLAGFELHEWEVLPVIYHHSATGPLHANDPVLAGFVAAFAAHDYDGAQQVALALADPWRRGVALCHLVGWLDGRRDGRFDLIDAARAALVLAQPSHPGAAWLLDQLDQLQRALDHLEARGYLWAKACPSEGGKGFLNKDCAGQQMNVWGVPETNGNGLIALRLLSGLCATAKGPTVLEDVKVWNAGAGGSGSWEPSPLVFAALKLYGVTLAAINPQLSVSPSDPESAEWMQSFRDIFQYGFLAPAYDVGDFPKETELLLFERYAELGKHPYFWDDASITSVLTDAQIDASWWASAVQDLPDPPGAAGWAVGERDVLACLRSVCDYWLVERLQHGELGGGIGDDVELIAQLAAVYGGQQDQASRRSLDGIDDIARYAWEQSGLVEDGYYSGPVTDSEHTAEYTTDVAMALRCAFGHSRRELVEGLLAGRHLVSADDPAAAWAANTSLGRLHLKSYWFTTDGPDTDPDHAIDIALNGRALLASVVTASVAPLGSAHPLAADLRRWADAWRDDALSTANGKPAGFLAAAQWPSNVLGNGGYWWSGNGSAGDTEAYAKSQVGYELELLRLAYHTSVATDRWRYLLPAVRMFRAVQQWEDAGEATGAQGSQAWAAKLFRAGPRFHALTVSHLQDLAADTVLTTTDDPSLSGSAPYVDAVLLARLHAWTEQMQDLVAGNYALAYAAQPFATCGLAAKPPAQLEWFFDHARPYLRAIYPLLTARAIHTDRIFVNHSLVLPLLLACHTGGDLAENVPQRPAIRWVGKFGAPLDLAVLVNGRSWDESWISAWVHNFGSAPVTVDLLLEEGLRPGNYVIDVGSAAIKCDELLPGNILTSTSATKSGAGLRVPVQLPVGRSLVRVQRQGAPDAGAAAFDLAVDPPELEFRKQGAATSLVFRARIANVGAAASPAAPLEFRVVLVLPDGTAIGLMPGDITVGTMSLPPLAACNGWQPDEAIIELPILLTDAIADILGLGFAVQVRAEMAGPAGDWNPLNNTAARAWLPAQIPIVTLP